jgi:TolA-binding protein
MVTHHREFIAISVLAAALLPFPVRAGQTARPTVSPEKLQEQLEQQQQRIAELERLLAQQGQLLEALRQEVSKTQTGPSAASGAGEVAPIRAAYSLPYLLARLNDQFMELGYHIFILSTQSTDVEATKPLLYTTVFFLLALTFLLNLAAIAIRTRLRVAAGRA